MIRRSSILLVLLLSLSACRAATSSTTPSTSAGASESPAATESSTPVPSESDSASTPPSQVPTTEPIPPSELGEFTCDLPIVEQATVPGNTNYMDVRVGTHDGYDRVVFEFNVGIPEFTLERDEPPYLQDASGFEVDVEGESVLHLVLRGGTAMMDSGEISYDGPLSIDVAFPTLVDVEFGGDFEAQTTWFIGLSKEACVRVLLLTDPHRIVIDVEH